MKDKKPGVRTLVRKYLKKAKLYRNNDKILTLKVWQEYGFVLTPEQHDLFMNIPDAATIERRRREMRAEFPDSINIQERRFKTFQQMRDERSSNWLVRRMRRFL